MASHAAEDLVVVVGPHLQRLLSEDDLPGGDVTSGHHVASETGKYLCLHFNVIKYMVGKYLCLRKVKKY